MGDDARIREDQTAIDERRRKLAEWYEQYELVQELMLDTDFVGTLKQAKEWQEDFRAEMVCNLAGDVSGKAVLDIGCQYGVFSFSLAERAAHVTGLDISRKWVDRCTREADSRGLENTTFLVADAQDLPFDDGAFDMAICTEVIEHVDYAGRLLQEIFRILKDRGVLVLGTPNTHSYYVAMWKGFKRILPMDAVRWVLKKLVRGSEEDLRARIVQQIAPEKREAFERESAKLEELGREIGIDDPAQQEFSEHIREFSRPEIEELLYFTGFAVERRTGFPIFPTYYFLGPRTWMRRRFVKVKDESWWRYRSAPQMYLRAVKAKRPIFQA